MIEGSPHALYLSSWVAGERARKGSELLPQGTLMLPLEPCCPLAEEDCLITHRDGTGKDSKMPSVREEAGHSAQS